MSEFNTPISCEQASPSRIAPADAVKNGVAYLLADLGVFSIVEGAQLVVGFAWGVGFAALWAAGFFPGDVEAVFDAQPCLCFRARAAANAYRDHALVVVPYPAAFILERARP